MTQLTIISIGAESQSSIEKVWKEEGCPSPKSAWGAISSTSWFAAEPRLQIRFGKILAAKLLL